MVHHLPSAYCRYRVKLRSQDDLTPPCNPTAVLHVRHLQGFSGFLKRSFVLLSLTLTNLTADYYEADFDCWSQSNYFSSKRGTCEYQTPVKVWSETI